MCWSAVHEVKNRLPKKNWHSPGQSTLCVRSCLCLHPATRQHARNGGVVFHVSAKHQPSLWQHLIRAVYLHALYATAIGRRRLHLAPPRGKKKKQRGLGRARGWRLCRCHVIMSAILQRRRCTKEIHYSEIMWYSVHQPRVGSLIKAPAG